MSMISNFTEYVKQTWLDKPNKTTPLSAARLTHMEDGIKGNSDALAEIKQTFLNAVYPIGSIYMSVNNTNPATLFGGARGNS